jgi:hypothetical protein
MGWRQPRRVPPALQLRPALFQKPLPAHTDEGGRQQAQDRRTLPQGHSRGCVQTRTHDDATQATVKRTMCTLAAGSKQGSPQ